MHDASGVRPGISLVHRQDRDFNFLIRIPLLGSRAHATLDEHQVAAIVHDRGIWIHRAEQPCGFSDVAGFLLQLAHAGRDRIFAVIDHAAGNLPGKSISAVAELINKYEPIVRREREHVYPVRGIDDDKLALRAAHRVTELHAAQVEDTRGGERATGAFLPTRQR
jgi:hypothetical protein